MLVNLLRVSDGRDMFSWLVVGAPWRSFPDPLEGNMS